MSTLNEISQMVITGQIRTIKAKVQQALDEGIGASTAAFSPASTRSAKSSPETKCSFPTSCWPRRS